MSVAIDEKDERLKGCKGKMECFSPEELVLSFLTMLV